MSKQTVYACDMCSKGYPWPPSDGIYGLYEIERTRMYLLSGKHLCEDCVSPFTLAMCLAGVPCEIKKHPDNKGPGRVVVGKEQMSEREGLAEFKRRGLDVTKVSRLVHEGVCSGVVMAHRADDGHQVGLCCSKCDWEELKP